jgi:1-phosphofructokinase
MNATNPVKAIGGLLGAGSRSMILTVTPNPSLDRTYEIPALERGAVLRARADRVDPGGKGVNVSRAVASACRRTAAVLPLGGPEGALLSELLLALGVTVARVPIAGSTRVNVSVVEPDTTLTKVNAAGPELSAREARELLRTAGRCAARASWTVCCGSLPRGLEPEWYAELVERAHHAGSRVALDTSGPALTGALAARPDIVKPNAEELAEAVGRELACVGDAVKAAEELRAAGAGAVLASLGAAGQLLVDGSGAYFGGAPVAAAEVRSDVGAGDASLAGFLTTLADGGSGPESLASAVAHGAAAVRLPGSSMPTPAELRPADVTVTADVPLDRPLSHSPSPPSPSSPDLSSNPGSQ